MKNYHPVLVRKTPKGVRIIIIIIIITIKFIIINFLLNAPLRTLLKSGSSLGIIYIYYIYIYIYVCACVFVCKVFSKKKMINGAMLYRCVINLFDGQSLSCYVYSTEKNDLDFSFLDASGDFFVFSIPLLDRPSAHITTNVVVVFIPQNLSISILRFFIYGEFFLKFSGVFLSDICCLPHLTGKYGTRPFYSGSGCRAVAPHASGSFQKCPRPRRHSPY